MKITAHESSHALRRGGRKCNFISSPKRNFNRGVSKVANEASNLSLACPSSSWITGGFDSLPEVPMFYPIERTSTVVDCCDPREITNRILRLLQQLSITAKFNSEEASAFAEALDYTKFYIRLYKNNMNKSNSTKTNIIVELQRASGDPFNFIKYTQAIIAAARGEAFNDRNATRRRSSLNYIPASVLCHSDKSNQHKDKNSTYMVHVEELIKKDSPDAVLLGIESLLVMTDQERSHVSLCAAEAVLCGANGSTIKDFIYKCIHCPLMLSPEDNDFDYASRQCDIIHTTALAILGNSLQTTLDAEGPMLLNSLLQSEEWMGRNGVVDVLLSEVAHAEDRSHDAYYAARCLNMLLDSQMKMTLIERGLSSVMEVSQTVGQRRHSLLARECDVALALMRDV